MVPKHFYMYFWEPLLYSNRCLPRDYQIVRVWRNEFTRVICDRLISVEDQTLMRNHMIKMLTKCFPPEPKPLAVLAALDKADEDGEKGEEEHIDLLEYVMRDPLLFGDYRNAVGKLKKPKSLQVRPNQFPSTWHRFGLIFHHLYCCFPQLF